MTFPRNGNDHIPEPISETPSKADLHLPQGRPMRVLHLCSSLAGGGAERQLCYLSRNLGSRGHQIDIGVAKGGPNIHLLADANNVRLHLIGRDKPISANSASIRNYSPFVFPRVLALIRKLRPDVVQTWIPQMDIVGGMMASMERVPWVIREPNSALLYSSGNAKIKLRAWLGRNASIIIANSNGGSEYWSSVSPSTRCVVIRNGVPLSELERTPRLDHPEIPSDTPLILWAGRLNKQKNIERTFQAMLDAVSHSSAQMIVCGAGPLQSRLQEMLAQIPDPSRVRLWPYQTQLWPLMKRADVFVSASLCEGAPNVVMEAMACRCPLVVSDISTHRELLSPESAEFVDPGSVSSISAGIQRVLADRMLARERSQRAYADIAPFSVEEMTIHYEALYRSLSERVQ